MTVRCRAFLILLAMPTLGAMPKVAPAASPHASAALVRRVGSRGRAEVSVRYVVHGASGGARAVHGTLALEPPALARIDIPASGEKLVARSDGGEWLQPATKQMIMFRAQQAAPALRWWRVLLDSDRNARERTSGTGHYVLTLLTERGVPEDSAEVWLDARGLPVRLSVPAGDPGAAEYRLGGWRFLRARGAKAFRLALPAGYESVEWP